MSALVLRGRADCLPLPDESVDLICTSPPYFGLRSYTDGGEHYEGQIGSEATPQEYLANLLHCTREWLRVLKPSGSIFVNLGDKYVADNRGSGTDAKRGAAKYAPAGPAGYPGRDMARHKSLLGLPWRYALDCMDQLGLILRAEITWAKPNGLPESVQDRVRRSHEQVFHFTRQPRYYAAVDEIREPHQPQSIARTKRQYNAGDSFSVSTPNTLDPAQFCNPLGKLPGSVWEIPSAPLIVPAHLGIDHFAAYPPELCRRIILGWSPPGICAACGEGRRPVVDQRLEVDDRGAIGTRGEKRLSVTDPGIRVRPLAAYGRSSATITGYACACTLYTDHPASGESTKRRDRYDPTTKPQGTYGRHQAGEYERVGPWREYHLDAWTPPPVRPSVVVDPFGGTGTTALVADVLGRHGITVDLSADYCRLARWRTTDPGERARALGKPKPPPVPDGQGALFDASEAS